MKTINNNPIRLQDKCTENSIISKDLIPDFIKLETTKKVKIRYKKPDSVKRLTSLDYNAKVQRYSNIKPEWIPKADYRDDTANGLTKCIIDFIRLKGGQAERINSTGRQIKTYSGTKWIKGSGSKGTADISATIKGLSVKIEVKIGKDRQSEFQKNYQRDIELSGGIYYIAKNFTDFEEWFNQKFCKDEK